MFYTWSGQRKKHLRVFDGYLKILSPTPRTFKNRSPFFRAAYDDSDICMVDSDAAETFSAAHDKLHLLIQADSSQTS